MSTESKRLKELFHKAKNFDSARFDEYQENMAFYEGNQNKLSRYNEEKPWVVTMNTPYASLAIDTRVASLQASDYIGKIQPLSPDDVDTVQKINDLYVNQWKFMQMDNKISDAILRAAIVREAYIHVIFDPDKIKGGSNRLVKGALEAYFLDPGSVLIDPKAVSLKSADFLIVSERLTPEQAKTMYGIKREKEESMSIYSPSDRGENYLGNDYDSEQGDVFTKLTVYERRGQSILKSIMVDDQVVLSKEKLQVSVYPIAQLRWDKKAGSPYGLSLMDRILSAQKAINSIESAIVNSTLSTVAPQYVVRKDSGLDPRKVATFNGAPGVVYSVNGDPNSAIVPLTTPKIDPQIVETKREYEATIDKISSRTDQFTGDIGSAGNTAGGTNAAINRATIIEQKFLRNMEEFIEDITEILVQFLTKAFKGTTMYTRSQERADGSYEFGEISVTDEMEDIEYTFFIDLEVKTQYSRDREKSLILELYQIERQYDAPVKAITTKDILQKFEVSNREELVKRYDQLSKQDETMKAEIITRFTTLANQNQIDSQVVAQGIREIMAGKETPTVDQIVQQVEEQKAQMQEAQANMDAQQTQTQDQRAQDVEQLMQMSPEMPQNMPQM